MEITQSATDQSIFPGCCSDAWIFGLQIQITTTAGNGKERHGSAPGRINLCRLEKLSALRKMLKESVMLALPSLTSHFLVIPTHDSPRSPQQPEDTLDAYKKVKG